MTIDLNALRREFTSNGISREQMNVSPFIQFEHWMKQATEADLTLPNAMSIATSCSDEVSIRTVLLKSFDDQGFVFLQTIILKSLSKLRKIQMQPYCSPG